MSDTPKRMVGPGVTGVTGLMPDRNISPSVISGCHFMCIGRTCPRFPADLRQAGRAKMLPQSLLMEGLWCAAGHSNGEAERGAICSEDDASCRSHSSGLAG